MPFLSFRRFSLRYQCSTKLYIGDGLIVTSAAFLFDTGELWESLDNEYVIIPLVSEINNSNVMFVRV
jgi:hypothetical protein